VLLLLLLRLLHACTAVRLACAHSHEQSVVEAPSSSVSGLGAAIRKDVPILDQMINGRPLVYLDNAATSQKPLAVIQAMDAYYREYNSNVHRGVHHLSAKATTAYEEARGKVARFVNAASDREIVFTRNASEAINLVAMTWGVDNLRPGDEVRLAGGATAELNSRVVAGLCGVPPISLLHKTATADHRPKVARCSSSSDCAGKLMACMLLCSGYPEFQLHFTLSSTASAVQADKEQ
jgi:hypothetical protein